MIQKSTLRIDFLTMVTRNIIKQKANEEKEVVFKK